MKPSLSSKSSAFHALSSESHRKHIPREMDRQLMHNPNVQENRSWGTTKSEALAPTFHLSLSYGNAIHSPAFCPTSEVLEGPSNVSDHNHGIVAPVPRSVQAISNSVGLHDCNEQSSALSRTHTTPLNHSDPRSDTVRPMPISTPYPLDGKTPINSVYTSEHTQSIESVSRRPPPSKVSRKYICSHTSPIQPSTLPKTRSLLSPLRIANIQPTFATGYGEHTESPDRPFVDNGLPFPPSRPTSPAVVSPDVERAASPVTYDTFSWPPNPAILAPPLPPYHTRPKSARGWTTPRPETKEALLRTVLQQQNRPLSVKPQTEKAVYDDEKQDFPVCVEDDDADLAGHETIPPYRTQVNDLRVRSISAYHWVETPEYSPTIVSTSPALDAYKTTNISPPFDFSDPDRADNYVVSTVAAYTSSGVQTTGEGNAGISNKIVSICRRLVVVFQDLGRYKKFLSYRNEQAQFLLDFLQTLMDYSLLEEHFRVVLFVALLRLSRKSELYPRCFTLIDVNREGDPVTNGHFGEIYKGHFRGRVVCLKVVRMFTTSDQSPLHKAFRREGVLWGQFLHINVLPFYGIYQLGDTRNRIGLVSPWLVNGNIMDYLAKYPQTDRRFLIRDIVSGMIYLHGNGVVHGDLKPANVLVSDSGRACLADFGLSSVTDAHVLKDKELSSSDAEGGTVRFQAPELIDPELECKRSQAGDVYAFAMTAYQVFTDMIPFYNLVENYPVILKVIRGGRPLRPPGVEHISRGLTDGMWKLITKCWKDIAALRPSALQILERLPQGLVDTRGPAGWGDLTPSRFRTSGRFDRPDDSSVTETLLSLEKTGISLFEL